MTVLLNGIPEVPRPLKRVEGDKAKKYLELAKMMLARFPSDLSGRAVSFLTDLVRNRDPGAAPRLEWYSRAEHLRPAMVGLPEVVGRVAPALMKFEARFLR